MSKRNREISYLRLSITDRCNFRCIYCNPRASSKLVAHHAVASYEEMLKLVRISERIGIRKVRVTGGEPFVRRGLVDFLKTLCRIRFLKEVTVTTNGSLLNKSELAGLFQAGIHRLNFSLDTLNREKFQRITGKDAFQKVWETITVAHELGMTPVKINTVVLNGVNDDEIIDMARLTLTYPFHVRFIEYMPMGCGSETCSNGGKQLLFPELQQRIEQALGPLHPLKSTGAEKGPAKRYRLGGAPGEIGFITPISSHFCNQCNRLRLTATGNLRPCLLDDSQIDILTALRNGADDRTLEAIFQKAIDMKPVSHNLDARLPNTVGTRMFSIGG